MSDSFATSMPNRISELPTLAGAIRSFLEDKSVSAEAIDTVHLALDELISNIIFWGYADDHEHTIQVRTEIVKEQIRLTIEDDARPFDPTSLIPPDTDLAPDLRREGGLGVYLVRNTAEDILYRRVDGRNVVEVRIASDIP
jgi:serine/threonine-protein kinase RsbW